MKLLDLSTREEEGKDKNKGRKKGRAVATSEPTYLPSSTGTLSAKERERGEGVPACHRLHKLGVGLSLY